MARETSVQQSTATKGFFVCVPKALADALGLVKGQKVYWTLHTANSLILSKEEK